MKKANEPAFPTAGEPIADGIEYIPPAPGLTKREYFAGLAMQAILSSITINRDGCAPFVAESAVTHSDALLAELEKEKP